LRLYRHCRHLTQNYFFKPDFIAVVCGELGMPWRSNDYAGRSRAAEQSPPTRAIVLLSQEVLMSMTLHFHPLSSFCWKALIGLYELEVPFEKRLVDLSNDTERAAFVRLWPIGKFPVLRDDARDRTVPESTIILEYIDRWRPGKARLIPADPDRAVECRLRDRLFDAYIHLPMQKIVGDRLRPEGQRDPLGVEQARAQMETAYDLADEQLREEPWAVGAAFTLADCAALPALFYGDKVAPFGPGRRNLAAYFERLRARPSVERVLEEAAPYLKMFPGG
jgi:glutathione S-transferase